MQLNSPHISKAAYLAEVYWAKLMQHGRVVVVGHSQLTCCSLACTCALPEAQAYYGLAVAVDCQWVHP